MMKYKSRIDWWFWCISVLLLGIGAVMLSCKSARTAGIVWTSIITAVLVMSVFDTSYIFEQESLIVRFSLFEKYVIPYMDIVNITKIRNFDKDRGIGLSADRIKIEWFKDGGKEYVLVSPKDRDGFIKEINGHRFK